MLILITSLGLFFGLLSLWVFFLGITPWGISVEKILVGVFLLILFPLFLSKKIKLKLKVSLPRFSFLEWSMVAVIFASSFRILLYSLFYPFVTWDNLVVYGLAAKKIFQEGSTNIITGHPPFLALSYATTFFLSGGLNEQLAKAIPAILAILTIGATYLLGKMIFNQRVGLLAAFLLAITPLFKTWAGAGYADIPGTFFFLMAINFFYLEVKNVEKTNKRFLILTGIFTGLALWTKQSTLTLLISYPLVVVTLKKKEFISYINISYIFILAFLTGGFWYLRNFWLTREFFPAATSWWTLAGRNIRNLIPFMGHIDDFGYWLAPLYTFAFIFAIGLWRNKKIIFLLSFALPYFLLWWYFYSYETRFLLTILPILTIFCAFFIDEIFLKKKIAFAFPKLFGLVLILGVSLSTIYAALCLDLLKERNLSLEQKRERHLGDAYQAFKFLKEKEPLAVVTTDNRVLYFLDKSKVSQEIPKTLADLKGFNYFLFSPWAEITSQRMGWSFKSGEVGRHLNDLNHFNKLFESGDYVIYEIKNE